MSEGLRIYNNALEHGWEMYFKILDMIETCTDDLKLQKLNEFKDRQAMINRNIDSILIPQRKRHGKTNSNNITSETLISALSGKRKLQGQLSDSEWLENLHC